MYEYFHMKKIVLTDRHIFYEPIENNEVQMVLSIAYSVILENSEDCIW